MPFGLRGAAASFQRLMDRTLKGLRGFAVAYVDDILVYSMKWEEHLAHLRLVLEALRHAGLVVNRKTSHFRRTAVQCLGFNISGGNIWAVQGKVAALTAVLPTIRMELQSFLGLANYYRCFVPHFASTTAPLTDLLRGIGKANKPVTLNTDALRAFQDIKMAVCSQTIVHTLLEDVAY